MTVIIIVIIITTTTIIIRKNKIQIQSPPKLSIIRQKRSPRLTCLWCREFMMQPVGKYKRQTVRVLYIQPFKGTLIPINGPLYSNWPLMGGLLYLVERGGAEAPASPWVLSRISYQGGISKYQGVLPSPFLYLPPPLPSPLPLPFPSLPLEVGL